MEFSHNTFMVLASVLSLGAACGIIGSYIMFYKKALVSDAVSHATLPGIAAGFFIALALGLEGGKFLPLLLLGAALSGALSSIYISWIIRYTRLPEDTAISSALSLFFGLGIVLFSIIQNLDSGNRSGLESFLLGQTSGITSLDAILIVSCSLLCSIAALAFHKQFILQSFDLSFSKLQNSQNSLTQKALSLLMLLIVCTGLKTTGAILILALLIIPAGAARLICDNNKALIATSATIGVISAGIGTLLSAHFAGIPTGACIVLCAFTIFIFMFCIHQIKSGLLRHG